MIDQELIDYVKVLCSHNQTDENSKNRLVTMNKWSVEEIDEALQTDNENINQITDIKENSSNKLYSFFLFLSILYIIRLIIYLFFIWDDSGLSVDTLINLNSWILVIPPILTILTIFIIYSTIKIRVLSKKSWLLSLIATIIVPLLYILGEALTFSVFNQESLGHEFYSILFDFWYILAMFGIPSISLLLIIPIFLTLVLSFKKANKIDRNLLVKEKIILMIITLSFISVSLFKNIPQFITVNKVKNLDSLKTVRSSVPFKVYVSSQLPKGFYYTSDFNVYSSLDYGDAKTIVSIEINSKPRNGLLSDIVHIHQIDVDDGFNLEGYIKNRLVWVTNSKKINITNSKDGGYLLDLSPEGFVKSKTKLLYVTKENVLIDIDISKFDSGISTKDTAIQIAESLK